MKKISLARAQLIPQSLANRLFKEKEAAIFLYTTYIFHVLLVHCCVFQISCIQGTPLYPVSWRASIILTRTHLQPNLQLESPFLWPLLSMCSSSESSSPARKGVRIPTGSFWLILWHSCLFRVARPFQSNRCGEGTITWGMFLWGCGDTVACRWLLSKGGAMKAV